MSETRPDLFVDANLSGHFARPVSPEYCRLIQWLREEGWLVVCRSLTVEYHKAVRGSTSPTTLVAIVEKLQRNGRLRSFSKSELRAFHIPTSAKRRLRSNRADHDFIKVILLSDRKLGLSEDRDLAHDINTFPGHHAHVARAPSEIAYRK